MRFFITYPYEKLDSELRRHTRTVLGGKDLHDPGLRCQTLLASAGIEPDWNDRRRSRRYKVLPLTEQIVDAVPMYAQVKDIFGIIMNREVSQDPQLLVELEHETYNVLHVMDVPGNPYIPDQEHLVLPYGIRSVLGLYGMLPSCNLFTMLVFSKAQIPRETSEYFKTLALNVKLAILPFDDRAVFAPETGVSPPIEAGEPLPNEPNQFRSRASSLAQLLGVQEQVVDQQSQRIELMLAELRHQTLQMAETNQTLNREIAENVRLRQQAAEAAVLQERNRLAWDLHDSVTQALLSQTLYAEAAARQLDSGVPELAAEHLRQLQETAQQALREMRLLIFELRPPALETEGLIAALTTRLEAVEARAGLETQIYAEETLHLPPDVEIDLYKIAQEALNNALKYAQAGKVSLSLAEQAGRIV